MFELNCLQHHVDKYVDVRIGVMSFVTEIQPNIYLNTYYYKNTV